MSKLDDAFLKHFEYLNKVEGKPVCYKDFEYFVVDGKIYRMMHGTFRNKISDLIRNGVVELCYNSKVAFYVLKGIRFGKHNKAAAFDRSNEQRPYCHTCRSCHGADDDDDDDCPVNNLFEAIDSLPKENNGLHNFHLKFETQDIYTILSESRKYPIDPKNKGIKLRPFNFSNLRIVLSIYPTNTCSVTVACSENPVYRYIDDFEGVIRLATSLARTQERLQRIVDEAGSALPGGYEQILIPDIDRWMVTMCHFATDSPNCKEAKYCITWKDGQRVLYRVYSKKLKRNKGRGMDKDKDSNNERNNDKNDDDGRSASVSQGKDGESTGSGNSIIRSERQEYPSKTLGDMFRDI
ncbi:MAG: hypothetical protein WBX01_09125 [Nitrososphaeraceae archaeon]